MWDLQNNVPYDHCSQGSEKRKVTDKLYNLHSSLVNKKEEILYVATIHAYTILVVRNECEGIA
jgi:hypothetical protein